MVLIGRLPLVRAGVAVASAVLVTAGCSDGDTSGMGDGGDRGDLPADGAGTGGATETIVPIPVGDLPDPCTLFAPNELASLAGGDPGAGAGQSTNEPPRRICTFDSGLVLSVEGAADWGVVVDAARERSGPDALETVDGVGDEAFWNASGQQFFAVDDRYVVGVGGVRHRSAGEVLAVALLDVL